MSLIGPQPTPDPLQAGVNKVRQLINSVYPQIKQILQIGGQTIWGTTANPNKWHPQMAVDRFGRDAGELFTLSGLAAPIVAYVDGTAPQVMPEGWSATINPNGTVKLIPPPESSSSSSSSSSEEHHTDEYNTDEYGTSEVI